MTSNNNHNHNHSVLGPLPQERLPSGRNQDPQLEANPITQEEIRELARLKQLSEIYSHQRALIRARLIAGATVEPGARGVRIETREVVSFSKSKLLQLLGQGWIEHLQSQIPPEVRRELVIVNTGAVDPLGD